MFDIITIGSATRDVFLKMSGEEAQKHETSGQMEECFILGAKVEVKGLVLTSGGGGTNAAVTFGRQGFNTSCVGVIGMDINGQEIISELHSEGIDTGLFQRHEDDFTAYSTILANPNGERTILSYKGEGQHFDVSKVPFEKMMAKWFYVDSLGGHYDLFEALINHAAANSIKVACNPGGKEIQHGIEKLKPLLTHMEIYITNKEEGEELLGIPPSQSEDVARKLKEYVPGVVSVSDGHNGVTVIDKDGKVYTAGVPDSPVVERTGAGDAFGSGFVVEYMRSTSAGLHQSQAIEKSIQFGTANASSVVTQFGAKAGILKKDDWGPWPLVEVKTK